MSMPPSELEGSEVFTQRPTGTIPRMQVFELHWPGMALDGVPDDQQVRVLLFMLESQLADASVGVAFFNSAMAQPRPTEPPWVRRRPAVRAIQEKLERELPEDATPDERFVAQTEIIHTADLEARRHEWASGQMPEGYKHRLPFIYSHIVIYALDAIGKIIDSLADEIGDRFPGLEAARDGYRTALPYLVSVRNSAHHIEDRGRRTDRRGRPLIPQPMNNGMINAQGGDALIISSLNGNRMGYTSDDGSFQELEISVTSVTLAQTAIQQVIDSLPWRGPARSTPS